MTGSFELVGGGAEGYRFPMENAFRERLKKKVGGSLTALPPLQRLEMLRRNALMLRKGQWKPPANDGTLVRKTVGASR